MPAGTKPGLALAGGLLALLLAACGPVAYDCTDPLGCLELPPGEALVIGMILTVHGPGAPQGLAAYQELQAVVDGWEELLGHPLVLVRQGTDCNDREARRAATLLALEAGLAGVVGPTCPQEAAGARAVLSDAGLPLLTPGSGVGAVRQAALQLFRALERVSHLSADGSLSVPRLALLQALQDSP